MLFHIRSLEVHYNMENDPEYEKAKKILETCETCLIFLFYRAASNILISFNFLITGRVFKRIRIGTVGFECR